MKLENYKVRVSNESESKEVQELFFEIGYVWRGLKDKSDSLYFPKNKNLTNYQIIAYKETMDMQMTGGDFKGAKELTIDQLRSLVSNQKTIGKIPYLVKTIDKWEEQELTSDTPESATCLKIPDGADAAVLYKTGAIEFFKSDFRECYHGDKFKWFNCSKAPEFYTLGNVIWRSIPETMHTRCAQIPVEFDAVNHPSHYTKGSIECIDALESATVGKTGIEAVCVANIIKYLWRYEEKNGLEDVKKAKWYMERLIKKLEEK